MKVLKFIGYAIAGVIGLFVIMLIIGAMTPEEKRRQYEHEATVERECDKMMADSALGSERRMTREICDRMKADLKKQYGK